MDERTLTALRGSIEKWQGIANGSLTDIGCDNCPLCEVFYSRVSCKGCPVAESTGKKGCQGSPYYAWLDVQGIFWPKRADTPERVAAAQAELDFLISLLPTETPVTGPGERDNCYEVEL